ncbi:hypothetical protein HNQ08_003639 [Deinococcus humi]|uniref:Uncharacterized protein n=1 Tax=Deinococcus humi TaxID=662880 RepID=A0A7W8JZA3_9DEIO|nr:hypothetical protein [Deinococcus humi]GGO38035.1 hypothetical protein GCM10008949_44060 [Deinococcus humi]
MRDTQSVHGDLDLILPAEAAERFRFPPDIRHWGSETFVIPSEAFGIDPAFTFRQAPDIPPFFLPWLQDVTACGQPIPLCHLSALELLNRHGPLNEENRAWVALRHFLEAVLPQSPAWCFILSHASEGPYELESGDLSLVLHKIQRYGEEGTGQSFVVRFPPPPF